MLDWLKSVTFADGSHLQMQWGVFGMAAVFQQIFLRLLRSANVHEYGIGMALAEMRAQTALTLLNV
jgi:hypothetical protein